MAHGAFVVSDATLTGYYGCLVTQDSTNTLHYTVGKLALETISKDQSTATIDGKTVTLISGAQTSRVQDLMKKLYESNYNPLTRKPRNLDLEAELPLVVAQFSAPQKDGTRTFVTLDFGGGITERRPVLEIFRDKGEHFITNSDRTKRILVPLETLKGLKAARDLQMTNAAKAVFTGSSPCIMDQITAKQRTSLETAIDLTPKLHLALLPAPRHPLPPKVFGMRENEAQLVFNAIVKVLALGVICYTATYFAPECP